MPINLDEIDPEALEDYGPGEVVFTQGEIADHMYLVVDGAVELKVGGETVATVERGGTMGEMSLLDKAPRSALAIARGDCQLLPINPHSFEDLVRKDPEWVRTLMRSMAERLRAMNVAAGGTGGHGDASGEGTGRLDIGSLEGTLLKEYAPGEVIFAEGDPVGPMVLVQDGTIEVVVNDQVVHTVETGGFVGEMAILEDAPRSATARASTACRVLPVDRERFDFLVRKTPDFVIEMLRVMAGRIRRMNEIARARADEAGDADGTDDTDDTDDADA